MANYQQLKDSIASVIKTNGNNEITGALLQSTLNAIVNTVGKHCTFAGLSMANGIPENLDYNIFYIAIETGVYINFSNISVNIDDGINILEVKNGIITKRVVPINVKASDSVDSTSVSPISSRALNNQIEKYGIKKSSLGFLVKAINDFPFPGGIAFDNGILTENAALVSTDFVELPKNWEEVEYYHLASDVYGLSFYNSNKARIAAVIPNTQDSVLVYKLSENYDKLKDAKYIRATRYLNNASSNHKNKLIIKTSIDLTNVVPKLVDSNIVDNWRVTQRNLGNSIVDYDYRIFSLAGASKNSDFVDITGFNEIIWNKTKSSLASLFLFDENFTQINSFLGDTNYSNVFEVIKSSDYPLAKYCKVFGNDSIKDSFIISVSYTDVISTNSEIQKNNILKVKGYEFRYISFPEDFKETGVVSLLDGVLNTALTNYKSVVYKKLPENWEYIEYDNFLSEFYGLAFFDSNKGFIKGVPNKSITLFYPIRIYKKDVINAEYFSYSWADTFAKKLIFKIAVKEINAGYIPKPMPEDTRLANSRITDFDSFNLENPTTPLIKQKLFSDEDIPGKPYARIPSIILTNNKTIISAVEFRDVSSVGNDKGAFDLMVKRKTDLNDDWESQILFPNNSATYGRAMNPSFLVDRTGAHGVIGRIYCFVATIKDPDKFAAQSTTEELDLLYRYSDDDGVSWSNIFSLKSKWDLSKYTGSLVSPTNGIQLTNGTFVVPCMVVVNATWKSGLLYKKPTGDWVFSEPTPRVLDNESLVVEHETNKVLLNCRFEGDQVKLRSVYEFDFEIDKFKSHISDRTFEPYHNCQMSIEKINIGSQKIFLMSFPDKSDVQNPNPNISRFHYTVWASLDCIKWVRVYVAYMPQGYGYGVLSYYNNRLVLCYEVLDPSLEVDFQDITNLLPSISYAVNVEIKRTAEERLNSIIYQSKGWTY